MNLKMYRRIAGLTPTELAAKSGVSLSIISRLESGERQSASFRNIVRLARALNLEPEELCPVEPAADQQEAGQ